MIFRSDSVDLFGTNLAPFMADFLFVEKKEAKFTELERKFQIHFYFKRALYATINLSFAKKKF